jgi:hypothetical protein
MGLILALNLNSCDAKKLLGSTGSKSQKKTLKVQINGVSGLTEKSAAYINLVDENGNIETIEKPITQDTQIVEVETDRNIKNVVVGIDTVKKAEADAAVDFSGETEVRTDDYGAVIAVDATPSAERDENRNVEDSLPDEEDDDFEVSEKDVENHNKAIEEDKKASDAPSDEETTNEKDDRNTKDTKEGDKEIEDTLKEGSKSPEQNKEDYKEDSSKSPGQNSLNLTDLNLVDPAVPAGIIISSGEISSASTKYKLNTKQKNALKYLNIKYGKNSSVLNAAKSGQVVIFGLEGMGSGFGTQNSVYTKGRYRAMMVVIKDGKIKGIFKSVSTTPDKPFTGGIATTKSGIYKFVHWRHRSTYPAIQVRDLNTNSQSVPAYYFNTRTGQWATRTAAGINFHKGNSTSGGSEGCQIFISKDAEQSSKNYYTMFAKSVGYVSQNLSDSHTIVNGDALLSISGVYVLDRGLDDFYAFRWEQQDHHIDSMVKHPNGYAYIFRNGEYFKYHIGGDQALVGYPLSIKSQWRNLASDFISNLKGALLSLSGKYVYWFKGSKYIKYNFTEDKMVQGYPYTTATNWDRLPNNIDATFTDGNYAYVFAGSKVLKYDMKSDKQVTGLQEISTVFKGIPSDFAKGIDAAFTHPDGNVYLFKKNNFTSMKLSTKTSSGKVMEIRHYWPGL